MSLLIFCVCAGCAFFAGCIEGLLLPLRKKLPLPFTVFSDIGLGILLVAPLGAAVFFLYDGKFSFYAAIFAAAFFAIGAKAGRAVVWACAKKRKPKKAQRNSA